jgi:hypothetical protein
MSGHFRSSPHSSLLESRIRTLGTFWILSKKEHNCVDNKRDNYIQEEVKSSLISENSCGHSVLSV